MHPSSTRSTRSSSDQDEPTSTKLKITRSRNRSLSQRATSAQPTLHFELVHPADPRTDDVLSHLASGLSSPNLPADCVSIPTLPNRFARPLLPRLAECYRSHLFCTVPQHPSLVECEFPFVLPKSTTAISSHALSSTTPLPTSPIRISLNGNSTRQTHLVRTVSGIRQDRFDELSSGNRQGDDKQDVWPLFGGWGDEL